ncbi:MAG: GNAT family N-acetyltransferase [Solirubrobacteraceae bacterium]|nr:GNAT family N-acetyltransferase [Solirubrobacteraceae bacterium]
MSEDPAIPSYRTHRVMQVLRSDRPAIAEMLATAFRDDPLSRWIYRDHPSRLRWVRADFRLRLAQHAADGLTYMTDDGSGAAVWAAPGAWKGHPTGQLRTLSALVRVARNHERIGAIQRELDRRHPAASHLYLALLGVAEERRHEGIGGALLAPTLMLADERALPCYVEAGSHDAAAFYATLGFALHGEVKLPGAPTVYLMWREPRRPGDDADAPPVDGQGDPA